MSKIKTTKYELNPEWNTMEIIGKWATWDIRFYADGDVEIACCAQEGTEYLILNQDELKQVIAFLQTKVK